MVRLLLPRRAIKNQGFTLIELLVVVVIGGILAAIAIPSFLSRANTAKQVEAKMYLGSLNRAQQAFYTQHGKFGNAQELGMYSQPTANYSYEARPDGIKATHYATATMPKLKSYSGMVTLVQNGSVMEAIICEAENPAAVPATDPKSDGLTLSCDAGTKKLN
jgi:type IV pilus assembly protein PilA